MRSAAKFAADNDLNDILPLLQKGALAAQNPAIVESMDDFDEADKEAFREEIEHKWRQPKILYISIILNSIAAAIQGWDQTGSNGANLSFPQAFGISDTGPACEAAGTCSSNQWLVGFINSCPYLAIFLFAGWISDPLNHWLGRRGVIFIAAVFSLLSPIGMAVTQNWKQLVVCRVLLGIGMGLKEVTVPVFSAEVAPTRIRGGLVMSWQLWTWV
jgi:MFS family permease